MKSEKEEDFIWTLGKYLQIMGTSPKVIVTDNDNALMNALSSCLPTSVNILCVWHVNKNVLANAKRIFQDQNEVEDAVQVWNELMSSNKTQIYNDKWKALTEVRNQL